VAILLLWHRLPTRTLPREGKEPGGMVQVGVMS